MAILPLLFVGLIAYCMNPDRDLAPKPKKTGAHVPSPKEVAEKFLAARSTSERLKWIKTSQQVETAMISFFQQGPGKTEEVTGIRELPAGYADESYFSRFEVSIKNGHGRLLCVPHDGKAGGSVDFKSYARFCSESWSSLLAADVISASEMRVFIKQSNYYNFGFSDDAEYISLVANSPDLDQPVFIYVHRTNKETAAAVRSLPPNTRCTLALESVDGSARHRQFLASKITAGWVEK